MALELIDLSVVTDCLLDQLRACRDGSSLWDDTDRYAIQLTGLAPDAARQNGGCHLSLYLFHVAVDASHRNTYPTGGAAQRIPAQPLSLTLYYLLSAYSADSYVQEQQAMGIGLKCFHQSPFIEATVPSGGNERFTLTLEPQMPEQAGSLWQAINTPLRLSAVFRVGVVFMEPEPRQEAKVVTEYPVIDLEVRCPPGGEPGQRFSISGDNLVVISGADFAASDTKVFLRALELSATTGDPPQPGRFLISNPERIVVRLPTNTPAGIYLLRVWPNTETPAIELTLEVT